MRKYGKIFATEIADRTNNSHIFWVIWNQIYPKIIDISCNGNGYSEKIVCEYLLAGSVWLAEMTNWHSLEKYHIVKLFERAIVDLACHTVVLYSIAKFLSGIRQLYVADGLFWIKSLIQNNNFNDSPLLKNACFNLEVIVKLYIENNKMEINRSALIKENIFLILDFLIGLGSTTAGLIKSNL